MAGAFLTVFVLLWTGMVCFMDGFMVHSIYKQHEALHFLTVTGTVTHSELTVSHSSKGGTTCRPVVQYIYEVGGQNFAGDKFRIGTSSWNYASASSMVKDHPDGSTIQVFYNPADPGESLLQPGVKGSDWLALIFSTPFTMVMLGLWIGIGGWLRGHWFKPPAGGVKIIADGTITRVRLPRFPALLWGMITTGGLGFISVFVVGFSTNMEPSIPVAQAVLIGIYLAGLLVFIWQQLKINSGIDDLVLDESSRTIELPLTFGRKQRVTAGLADIESLSVEKILHRSSKGNISYTYAPRLRLRRADAPVQKLADWADEMRANAFADWLRQKLNPALPATSVADAMAAKSEAEQMTVAAAREREYEALRRAGKTKIQVSDGPEGREFYFSPARNLGTAFVVTLVMLLFSSVPFLVIHTHGPAFFAIVFGLASVGLFFVAFNLWFKSIHVTVNSSRVRIRKQWLVFSRTREYSAGDYARFATKMGMQSGSTIFTDIRLVRAGADAEFARKMNRFQGSPQLDQEVVQRFRQGAGPAGVTVASSIANSAEAEWLVKEMNRAFGRE